MATCVGHGADRPAAAAEPPERLPAGRCAPTPRTAAARRPTTTPRSRSSGWPSGTAQREAGAGQPPRHRLDVPRPQRRRHARHRLRGHVRPHGRHRGPSARLIFAAARSTHCPRRQGTEQHDLQLAPAPEPGPAHPGVVNTDAHYNFHGSGWLRNYVKSPTDDPAEVETLDVVHAAERGHLVMTNGPFLEVTPPRRRRRDGEAGVPGDEPGGPRRQGDAARPGPVPQLVRRRPRPGLPQRPPRPRRSTSRAARTPGPVPARSRQVRPGDPAPTSTATPT